jgi:hypothetical protein
MTNTLYCFGESGNAYKAALALELAGIDWTPRFVDFFNGEARSPEFRAINPMGEVPVLDADGTILTQSGVIMTDAYIFDAVRTPRGKGRKDGALHEVTSRRLAGLTLAAIRDRCEIWTPRGRGRDLGQRHAGRRAGRLPRALAVLYSDL